MWILMKQYSVTISDFGLVRAARTYDKFGETESRTNVSPIPLSVSHVDASDAEGFCTVECATVDVLRYIPAEGSDGQNMVDA